MTALHGLRAAKKGRSSLCGVLSKTFPLSRVSRVPRPLWCIPENSPAQPRASSLVVHSRKPLNSAACLSLLWCRMASCGGLLIRPPLSNTERLAVWLCVPARIQFTPPSMSATLSCQQDVILRRTVTPPPAIEYRAARHPAPCHPLTNCRLSYNPLHILNPYT
jgi:hypothetical protein